MKSNAQKITHRLQHVADYWFLGRRIVLPDDVHAKLHADLADAVHEAFRGYLEEQRARQTAKELL